MLKTSKKILFYQSLFHLSYWFLSLLTSFQNNTREFGGSEGIKKTFIDFGFNVILLYLCLYLVRKLFFQEKNKKAILTIYALSLILYNTGIIWYPNILDQPFEKQLFILLLGSLYWTFLYVFILLTLSFEDQLLNANKNAELEKEIVAKKIKSFKHQLKEDFILHILTDLESKAKRKEDDLLPTLIEFSTVLRHILVFNMYDNIPLEKEFEFINNYIHLHREITPSVVIEVSSPENELDFDSVSIPPLSLFSIVEVLYSCLQHQSKNQLITSIHSIITNNVLTLYITIDNSTISLEKLCDSIKNDSGVSKEKNLIKIYHSKKSDQLICIDFIVSTT